MLGIVVYPVGRWAGFHRRPMLEALARNLLGKAFLLVVQPPLDGLRSLQSGEWREPARTALRRIEQQTENVWLLRSFTIPGSARFHKGIARAVGRALHGLPGVTRVAAMVFRPEQLAYVGLAGEDCVIYECYDEYRLEKGEERKDCIYLQEKQLLQRANVVLTTSTPLYESRKAEHPRVCYTPNGVDTRIFGQTLDEDEKLPDDLKTIARPIIGYVGNVRSWLDFDALMRVIPSLPKAQFVFIGPVSDNANAQRLARHANVHFIGVKPRSHLPRYLKHMDVMICPFRSSEFFQNAMPLKILEYLSAGKAVVATPLRAIREILDVVYPATGSDEMVLAINRALLEIGDPSLVEARLAKAAAYDWDLLTRTTASIILDSCMATSDCGPQTKAKSG